MANEDTAADGAAVGDQTALAAAQAALEEAKRKETAELEADRAAQSAALAAAPEGSMLVPLKRKSVPNGEGGFVKWLIFREPSAEDIEVIGNPIGLDFARDPPMAVFDAPVMVRMMSRLAAVPFSTIRKLHPKDWNNCAYRLAGFFLPDAEML